MARRRLLRQLAGLQQSDVEEQRSLQRLMRRMALTKEREKNIAANFPKAIPEKSSLEEQILQGGGPDLVPFIRVVYEPEKFSPVSIVAPEGVRPSFKDVFNAVSDEIERTATDPSLRESERQMKIRDLKRFRDRLLQKQAESPTIGTIQTPTPTTKDVLGGGPLNKILKAVKGTAKGAAEFIGDTIFEGPIPAARKFGAKTRKAGEEGIKGAVDLGTGAAQVASVPIGLVGAGVEEVGKVADAFAEGLVTGQENLSQPTKAQTVSNETKTIEDSASFTNKPEGLKDEYPQTSDTRDEASAGSHLLQNIRDALANNAVQNPRQLLDNVSQNLLNMGEYTPQTATQQAEQILEWLGAPHRAQDNDEALRRIAARLEEVRSKGWIVELFALLALIAGGQSAAAAAQLLDRRYQHELNLLNEQLDFLSEQAKARKEDVELRSRVLGQILEHDFAQRGLALKERQLELGAQPKPLTQAQFINILNNFNKAMADIADVTKAGFQGEPDIIRQTGHVSAALRQRIRTQIPAYKLLVAAQEGRQLTDEEAEKELEEQVIEIIKNKFPQ